MSLTAHLRPRDITLAALVNIAFGLNLIAMKVVVVATGPFTASVLRMGIVLLICARWFRLIPGKTRQLALYGAVNGGLFLLLMNLALKTSSNVSALAIAGQLGIPFSLVLGAVLLREHLSPVQIGGTVLAFAGVTLLVFDPAIIAEIPGLLIMASASFFWASGTLVQRKLGGVPLLTIQAWNGLMGLLVLAPFALTLERPAFANLPHMGGEAAGWLAFSCIFSTVLGQGGLAYLLQRQPISTIMPMMLPATAISIVCAALYFGSPLTLLMLLGATLTMAGVSAATLASARRANTKAH